MAPTDPLCPRCGEPPAIELGEQRRCVHGHEWGESQLQPEPYPLDDPPRETFAASIARLSLIESEAKAAREHLERLVRELGG